jgi:hypothetical protein
MCLHCCLSKYTCAHCAHTPMQKGVLVATIPTVRTVTSKKLSEELSGWVSTGRHNLVQSVVYCARFRLKYDQPCYMGVTTCQYQGLPEKKLPGRLAWTLWLNTLAGSVFMVCVLSGDRLAHLSFVQKRRNSAFMIKERAEFCLYLFCLYLFFKHLI